MIAVEQFHDRMRGGVALAFGIGYNHEGLRILYWRSCHFLQTFGRNISAWVLHQGRTWDWPDEFLRKERLDGRHVLYYMESR